MLVPTVFTDNFVDDMFDDFFKPVHHTAAPRPQAMNVDVKEFEDHYEIDLQLPGYKKEDIKADLKDGYLTIVAEHKVTNENQNNGHYLRRECFYGQVQRSFYVGEDVEQQDITAGFEDGILKIGVQKKEKKPAVDERKYITIN